MGGVWLRWWSRGVGCRGEGRGGSGWKDGGGRVDGVEDGGVFGEGALLGY